MSVEREEKREKSARNVCLPGWLVGCYLPTYRYVATRTYKKYTRGLLNNYIYQEKLVSHFGRSNSIFEYASLILNIDSVSIYDFDKVLIEGH